MWTHLFNGQFEFLDFDRYLKRYEIYYKENSADNKIWFELFQDRIDRNPDATPYDDLRHYAYEGDGNSGGSLSSLNSGTSDADLVRTCFVYQTHSISNVLQILLNGSGSHSIDLFNFFYPFNRQTW